MNDDARALYDLLCANHQRGLIFARGARLPDAIAAPMSALRRDGLVRADSYAPQLALVARRCAEEFTDSKGGWTGERKARFIEALERLGRVDLALEAIGLKRTTKAGIYAARRADPAFAARWDAILAGPLARRHRTARGAKGGVAPKAPRWTAKRKAAFVASLARTGNVAESAQELGLGKGSGAYDARRADAAFAAAWDAAVAEASAALAAAGKSRRRSPTLASGWTEAQIETLREGYAAGRPCADIGAEIGRSYRAVEVKASLLGLRHANARRGGKKINGRAAPSGGTTRPAMDADERGGEAGSSGCRATGRGPDPETPPLTPAFPSRAETDAGIAAQAAAHEEERRRFAAMAPPMSVEEAQSLLIRKGRRCNRMSVYGGSSLLWAVSGLGRDVTGEQLIAEAKRVSA